MRENSGLQNLANYFGLNIVLKCKALFGWAVFLFNLQRASIPGLPAAAPREISD
jgi:hypothetical protein